MTESHLLRAIAEQLPQQTLIMVSQRTSSLKAADQILVLDKGKQVGLGCHADLLESPAIYREIDQSQHAREVEKMLKQQKQSTLRQLLNRFWARPIPLGMMILGSLGQVLLTVYLPILIGQAIDVVLEVQGLAELKLILLQMVLVIGCNTVLQWWVPYLSNKLIYGVISDLRQEAFVHLHHLPLSYLDQQSTGDLMARVSTDSEQLSNGLLMIFNQFFIGVLTIVLTIFTMARLDFFMMTVVVILTPVSLFVARFIAKKSYLYYRKQTEEQSHSAFQRSTTISSSVF